MTSAEVDTVWHTHILYTRDYTDFCEWAFGHYIHHEPAPFELKVEPGNTALYLRVRRSDGGFLTTVTYPQIELEGSIYVSNIDPKGLKQHQWISVDTDTPLCQVLPYQFHDCEMETVAENDVPRDVHLDTVSWHCYDPERGCLLSNWR